MAYWACQLVGWGYFLVMRVVALSVAHVPLTTSLVQPWVRFLLGLGISHAFYVYVPRRWLSSSGSALVVRGIGAACAMTLLASVGSCIVEFRHGYTTMALIAVPLGWFVKFFGWVATYFAITLFRQRHNEALRSLRLEKAIQAAEVRALKSQLNPRWLFDSMDRIGALIESDPERARDAVTELSRTLRLALRAHPSPSNDAVERLRSPQEPR